MKFTDVEKFGGFHGVVQWRGLCAGSENSGVAIDPTLFRTLTLVTMSACPCWAGIEFHTWRGADIATTTAGWKKSGNFPALAKTTLFGIPVGCCMGIVTVAARNPIAVRQVLKKLRLMLAKEKNARLKIARYRTNVFNDGLHATGHSASQIQVHASWEPAEANANERDLKTRGLQ
ncbi:hypothetical protein [Paraburkholderia caledonica]|uniref:Uncharacterized protein n=1 Tax=Paraburkholderia caledonica TaxID=134536 RepID=A0AB73ILQ5_9BURK|nr:hypothetical protein [Paraburkholderia caledonica]